MKKTVFLFIIATLFGSSAQANNPLTGKHGHSSIDIYGKHANTTNIDFLSCRPDDAYDYYVGMFSGSISLLCLSCGTKLKDLPTGFISWFVSLVGSRMACEQLQEYMTQRNIKHSTKKWVCGLIAAYATVGMILVSE